MIPVVQLFRADAGDLAFPQGTDLLQILWCPNTHLGWRGPRSVAIWRNAADVADVADALDTPPSPTLVTREEYVPRPCVAHPEPLIDLPPICTLDDIDDTDDLLGQIPAELEQRLRHWDANQPEDEGYYYIAHAPGWKIGGWDGSWPDAAHIENCQCGAPMRPLLEVDRGEWLSGTWSPNQEPDFDWGDPARWQDQEPTGVNIGRDGMYWAHVCTADVNHPLTHSLE